MLSDATIVVKKTSNMGAMIDAGSIADVPGSIGGGKLDLDQAI